MRALKRALTAPGRLPIGGGQSAPVEGEFSRREASAPTGSDVAGTGPGLSQPLSHEEIAPDHGPQQAHEVAPANWRAVR